MQAKREDETPSGQQRPAENRNHQENTQGTSQDLPKPAGYPQASASTQAAAAGDVQPTGAQTPAGSQQKTFLRPKTEAAERYLKLLASIDD